MEFNPSPDTILQADDQVIVLGSSTMLKELERAAK
jgi:K+/H+ antiporter YhaU regulatory subunit KhtT